MSQITRWMLGSWFFVGTVVAPVWAQDTDVLDQDAAQTAAELEEAAKQVAAAAEANEKRGKEDAEVAKAAEKEEKIPPGRTRYKGRRIAQTMHYAGAPWLIRESREREEGCSKMVESLDVKPGMIVCDMGCGNGFYALKLAELVGDEGRVLAVDIQPEMLTLLKLRAKEEGMGKRIKPILGSVANPMLPDGEVDLILCADVYHEFSHPELMLKNMRKSLSDEGLVVLLEFREEDPKVPIKPLHKMSKAQVMKEMKPNGFRLVKEFDGLPWQHMMFFGKDGGDGEK